MRALNLSRWAFPARVRLAWVRLAWLGLFLCVAFGHAGPVPPAGFQRGNTSYAAGEYAQAAAAYESAVQTGSYSANLFYNLGNAYERLGQRGRAILNYQRALLIEPGHPEARANLAFVQGLSSGQSSAGSSWFSRELELPAIDLWPLLAGTAGWIGLTCLVMAGGRPRRLGLAAACLLGCAVAIGVTSQLDGGGKNSRRAIVVADRTRALYSPADSSKAIANLPAGSEVRVLSEQGAWDYAQLADGSRAWLAAANVEKVIPQGGSL